MTTSHTIVVDSYRMHGISLSVQLAGEDAPREYPSAWIDSSAPDRPSAEAQDTITLSEGVEYNIWKPRCRTTGRFIGTAGLLVELLWSSPLPSPILRDLFDHTRDSGCDRVF